MLGSFLMFNPYAYILYFIMDYNLVLVCFYDSSTSFLLLFIILAVVMIHFYDLFNTGPKESRVRRVDN